MPKRSIPLLSLLILLLFVPGCRSHHKTTLTLSVAASLKDALTEIEHAYQQQHPDVVLQNNYGSSGTLALEIEQGAPVDLFLSASSKPMNDLEQKGLLLAGSRRDLLRNEIVLIAPLQSSLKDFSGLTDGSVKLIAIGDPASVPAGQYGQQTLTSLQLLDKIRSKFVLGKDVRQVLTYVETGNADAGIVYATDAHISTRVRIVTSAPAGSHSPVVYPVAVLKDSRSADAARDFETFLSSPAARAIFEKAGFTPAAP
jgi:molybdate transport system substrate-binding protein